MKLNIKGVALGAVAAVAVIVGTGVMTGERNMNVDRSLPTAAVVETSVTKPLETLAPSAEPTVVSTSKPIAQPVKTPAPTVEPTSEPTVEPTPEPISIPAPAELVLHDPVVTASHTIIEAEFEGSGGLNFPYALAIPDAYRTEADTEYAAYDVETDTETKKPLILFLHGSGECGYDLSLLRNCYGFSGFVYSGQISPDAYILMPQCCQWWGNYDTAIMELLDELCEQYPIDRDRISITGHSLGASGTIQFVCNHPTYFYRCAPMSAQIDSALCEYWQTPVLFLVGEFDAPSSFIEANERLQELGKQSDIIVYPNEGHLIPPHYLDDDCAIVRWLIDE